jgi:hypothetical protein
VRQMPKMKRFPVSVPADLHRAFKVLCATEGKAMSETIRNLLKRECEAASAATPAAKLTKRPARNER